MPKGLRKSLYVKDEDLGHSFTNGNYVTLSATPYSELERITAIGLSPIFISVHATQHDVRLRLLGIKKAFPILDQMRFLEKSNIQFHTQIVVCPGFNAGDVLAKSIRDLLSFKKGLQSIAIVPVGLTKHRKLILDSVSEKLAGEICRYIQKESDKDTAMHGRRRLFLADEFFIKANISIPSKKYYEDYPQIENGVGLVRQLLEEWRLLKKEQQSPFKKTKRESSKKKQLLVITSHSAFAYVNKIIKEMSAFSEKVGFSVVAADNRFFGASVTVAGLLTAGDIVRTIRGQKEQYDRVFVPAVMFNFRGNTLDGFSAKRMEKEARVRMTVTNSLKDIAKQL
jgi:putative radical SAM enzyme (TIGR03279 family)